MALQQASSPVVADPDAGATVASAMVTTPKICDAGATVSTVRALLSDDHVHAALIVEQGILVAVVERADLHADLAPELPAARTGRLVGRTVAAHASLRETQHVMRAIGRRRLAVTDPAGTLLGLLCLKRHGRVLLGQRRPGPRL